MRKTISLFGILAAMAIRADASGLPEFSLSASMFPAQEVPAEPVPSPCIEAMRSENDGSDAMACYKAARDMITYQLDREQAMDLCRGARGTGPVVCYKAARNMVTYQLDRDEAIDLCRRARGTKPVDCYRKARDQGFERIEAIFMCAR